MSSRRRTAIRSSIGLPAAIREKEVADPEEGPAGDANVTDEDMALVFCHARVSACI